MWTVCVALQGSTLRSQPLTVVPAQDFRCPTIRLVYECNIYDEQVSMVAVC